MTTQLFQKAGQLFLCKRGGNRFFHEAQEWCNNKRTQNELSRERAMSKQRAFHDNMQIRQFHVERVLAHQLANEIMQGTSWREDAAGAVGCTLESNQHSRYEEELGIPRQLAYLEDRIFEGLPNKEAKGFPFAFLTSIPVGADLSLVLARFMVWLLIDPEKGVLRLVGKQGQAITAVASLYQRVIEGEAVSTQDWLSALTTASTRVQAAVDAANTFTTASAFSVAAAATSASLASHATVVAAAVAYISYGTGDVDPAVTNAVTATVTTLGYGNIAFVAADYRECAACREFLVVRSWEWLLFVSLVAQATPRSLFLVLHHLRHWIPWKRMSAGLLRSPRGSSPLPTIRAGRSWQHSRHRQAQLPAPQPSLCLIPR